MFTLTGKPKLQVGSNKTYKRILKSGRKLGVAGFSIELNGMKQEGDWFDSQPGPFCVESVSSWSPTPGGRISTSSLFFSFALKTGDSEGLYERRVCRPEHPKVHSLLLSSGTGFSNPHNPVFTDSLLVSDNPHKKGSPVMSSY